MNGLRRWWRWEMHRELQVTPFIRFITIERFVKGTVLVLGGIAILALSGTDSFHNVVLRTQEELNLNPGQHLWQRLYEQLVVRFGSASVRTRDALGAGAILYGLLEIVEGFANNPPTKEEVERAKKRFLSATEQALEVRQVPLDLSAEGSTDAFVPAAYVAT